MENKTQSILRRLIPGLIFGFLVFLVVILLGDLRQVGEQVLASAVPAPEAALQSSPLDRRPVDSGAAVQPETRGANADHPPAHGERRHGPQDSLDLG